MSTKHLAPYGTWKSPITSELIVAETIRLGSFFIDGEDLYFSEGRPAEGGRTVICRRTPDGMITDVTPAGFNVRTLVHEYGGVSWLAAGGVVYFTNFVDQRIWSQRVGEQPHAITPDNGLRYADFVLDAPRQRLIAVCEDHRNGGEAVNTIVAIPLDGMGKVVPLVAGHDFFAAPRLSLDGTRLAYLAWNHPNMPWDGTELSVAAILPDGTLGAPTHVAGSSTESVNQPVWSPDGTLYFVSDRSNWWNIFCQHDGNSAAVHPLAAEFGGPQWVFGMQLFAFQSPERIICAYTQNGEWQLANLATNTGELTPIATPYTFFNRVEVNGNRLVVIAASPSAPPCLVEIDLATNQQTVIRQSHTLAIDPEDISVPQAVEFPTTAGRTAHGFYYPPTNKAYLAPRGENPPLLVHSHGGPTSATTNVLDLETQYWTSRGVAVLDVNYGGSTGYGRDYRQRLNGQWGIVDVDDCINGAKYLVQQGLADGDRLMIAGGSAGGYTTLCALTFHDVFATGASHFGVSDIGALARDTHKFESRYMDSMVGPYPALEEVYKARSPIFHTDLLSRPIIFFQGLDDKVVPPAQSEEMVNALRAKGLPVAYVAFPGEQHGFRMAANIKRALDGEFYFYSRIFGFTPADQIDPVEIENLK